LFGNSSLGYLIPKGWKVLPLFRNIHHSPEIFPEPEKFDPSRFEVNFSLLFSFFLFSFFLVKKVFLSQGLNDIYHQVTPKPNTFMPFGNGTHSCPGNELAKLEMLVLLHHLTTKYRYAIINIQ
jgi:(+)-abscisic acid 8'-hydroxylase